MIITEVRIKLVKTNNEKLLGYASITLDNQFAVRDIRLINGNNGIFIAMPSRKMMARCPKCKQKNPVSAKFCNECGGKLDMQFSPALNNQNFHTDIAHPINAEAREMIHSEIFKAYRLELENNNNGVVQNISSSNASETNGTIPMSELL